MTSRVPIKSGHGQCGRWLAFDANASVYQVPRVDAIAGKPAPTWIAFQKRCSVGHDHRRQCAQQRNGGYS
ncbi:hypothetical protein FPT15_19270 [Pseudomonas sp. RGB]|nr:hypothetical protein FPT15_19270 [Pseudomonas sp. RGB]